jgi:hypothetical protein
LGLQGAAAELSGIAEDLGCGPYARCWAAEEAAWLGDARGHEARVALIGSGTADSYTRRRAAQFLVRLGDFRGTRLLAELASDPAATRDARKTAEQLLTQLDYVAILRDLALSPDTADGARIHAIDILASQHELGALADIRRASAWTWPSPTRSAGTLPRPPPRQRSPARLRRILASP